MQLDFFVPRNSSDLFRGGGGRRNTLETIKEDCFCPLTTARRCPALQQKKDANLNVKVSIINQLGEKGLPVGGGGGHPLGSAYCYGKRKRRACLGRLSGRYLAK